MPRQFASVPIKDAIAVPDDPRHPLASKLPKLKLGPSFIRWLSTLGAEVDARPKRQVHERIPTSSASIGTTPLGLGVVNEGMWRISVSVRVVIPGSVSSAIRVTILWTQGGDAQTEQTANLNGNLVTTREGKTFIIRADASTPISYATTYADGGGATAMAYELDIVAEELALDA